MKQKIKFLILNGSPRKDGNTYRINEVVKEKILKISECNNEESEFLEINLRNIDIPMCRGCATCFKLGEEQCPHRLIMKQIIERIEWCDCLIIASPVYSMQVSALLKNFLDHMSYNFIRPKYFDKKSLIISSSIVNDAKKTSKYLKNVLKGWGIHNVYSISITCNEFDCKLLDKDVKRIEKICNQLYDCINLKKCKKLYYKDKINKWRWIYYRKKEEYNVNYKYSKDNNLSKTFDIKNIFKVFTKKRIYNVICKLSLKK